MTDAAELARALGAVVDDLRHLRRAVALVGGLAVSVRGEVRFTRDVDLAVAVDDDEDAEGLLHALSGRGYVTVATVEQDAVGRLATARLRTPEGQKVDLLFASSGIEREIVDSADGVEVVAGITVPVAKSEHLLAMKLLSMSDRRLQDRQDSEGLVLTNPELDLELVRELLRLIESRGFSRRQDLQAKLDELVTVIGSRIR